MLQLIVWWLLVTGALLNMVIYALMNDNMRRTIKHAAFRLGMCRKDPSLGARVSNVTMSSTLRSTKNSSAVTKRQETTSLAGREKTQRQNSSHHINSERLQ